MKTDGALQTGWIDLPVRLSRYNLKIIFGGRFVWFLTAALAIFFLFMLQAAWDPTELSGNVVYGIMLFPSLLLVFYPAVFGIQNDADARMLEIIFGIPDYRYRVWGVRLLMIYMAVFVIIVIFAWTAVVMLCPFEPFAVAAQMMFPVLFFGNMAFLFSTITRSGNGAAVMVIVVCLLFLFFSDILSGTMWNPYLNPFDMPDSMHPLIWEETVMKNRIFLLVAAAVFFLAGMLNLQNREKFI
jgi:hypothetical protein